MPGILNWIKENTSKLMDPDREARIQRAASHIERELATHRRGFSLEAAVAGLGLYHEDIPVAGAAIVAAVGQVLRKVHVTPLQ